MRSLRSLVAVAMLPIRARAARHAICLFCRQYAYHTSFTTFSRLRPSLLTFYYLIPRLLRFDAAFHRLIICLLFLIYYAYAALLHAIRKMQRRRVFTRAAEI